MELGYVQKEDDVLRTLVRPGEVPTSRPAEKGMFGKTGPFCGRANRPGKLSKRKQDHAIQ
jgi:hypothetical protein